MKLENEYDLMDKIKDVNEPFGLMKIIRKKKLLIYLATANFLIITRKEDYKTLLVLFPSSLLIMFSIFLMPDYIAQKMLKMDLYSSIALEDLKKLVLKLNNLYLNTDINLLLKSKQYKKKYKVIKKEQVIPKVLESKYIMVPTYNRDGSIKETSIVQEHELGSRKYVLYLGSPEKKLKLAYVKA